jgi:hypothetical protein
VGGSAFAFRERILERYYLSKFEAGSEAERIPAAGKLSRMRSREFQGRLH